jgi:hypothetical protein
LEKVLGCDDWAIEVNPPAYNQISKELSTLNHQLILTR